MKVWPMFCKVCGRSIQPEDKFCSACGAAIAQEPFETAATPSSSMASAAMSLALATSTGAIQEAPSPAQNDLAPPSADLVLAAPRGDPRQESSEPIRASEQPPVEKVPPLSAQAQDTAATPDISLDHAPATLVAAAPEAALGARQFRRCPRCRRLNTGTDLTCDWCGTELPADTPASAPDPAANIPPPSFAGYAKNDLSSKTDGAGLTSKAASSDLADETNHSTVEIHRRTGLPVLEILVIVLLLAGAGTAMWILHSSLPGKAAAAPSSVVVTVTPGSAQVVAGKAFDFSASVSGTNDTQVTWAVEEGDAGGRIVTHSGKAKGGKFSSIVVYIAPNTPGTYHLVATSKADPRQSASAEATVTGK